MNIIKLYGTASSTTNNVANVLIPTRGRIRQVQLAFYADGITDNGIGVIEVSKASAREVGTNGAQQCIVEAALEANFVTSGLSLYGINLVVPVDVAVSQGQLIYLHIYISGTLGITGSALLHYT